eukprot:TRINITY_DN17967_c0_g1_i1.p2 TRINITY_DN17967_c0_g1~~TRINITY_DN17967_c0_g1_i1.p2  ORF type:complete len:211 (-),score=28.41 TRINITY_DN17967_c0_g1_i1:507-1067(-)
MDLATLVGLPRSGPPVVYSTLPRAVSPTSRGNRFSSSASSTRPMSSPRGANLTLSMRRDVGVSRRLLLSKSLPSLTRDEGYVAVSARQEDDLCSSPCLGVAGTGVKAGSRFVSSWDIIGNAKDHFIDDCQAHGHSDFLARQFFQECPLARRVQERRRIRERGAMRDRMLETGVPMSADWRGDAQTS